MKNECVLVWTTIAASADGVKLATALVEERLAACVNLLGDMQSVYRWKGGVEADRERQLIIKTTADRVPALQARVTALHDYDIPEFIVLPVIGGSDAYLDWIRESTGG
jgi:periplasmic divalent cation tolerance protein